MAWPFDARDFNFAPLINVPSNTLNEIQDKIVDINRDVYMRANYQSMLSAGTVVWDLTYHVTLGWFYTCQVGSLVMGAGDLLIRFPFRKGMVYKGYSIKAYIVGTTGPSVIVDKVDSYFSGSATPPSRTQVGSTQSLTGTAGTWQTLTVLTSETVDQDQEIVVRVGLGNAGDLIAGCRALVQPIEEN